MKSSLKILTGIAWQTLLLSSASSDRVPINQPPFKTINSTEWCKSPCTVKLISTHLNSLAIMKLICIVNLWSSPLSTLVVPETTLIKVLKFGVIFLSFFILYWHTSNNGINRIEAEKSPCLIPIVWCTTFIICPRHLGKRKPFFFP